MSRRLLIPLAIFALACMGSECSGSSSSGSSNAAGSTALGIDGGQEGGSDDGAATPVPEPSAALVFGAGLLAAGLVCRRRRED